MYILGCYMHNNSLPWKVTTRSDNFFDQGNDSTCCEATTSRQRTRSNYLLWETTTTAICAEVFKLYMMDCIVRCHVVMFILPEVHLPVPEILVIVSSGIKGLKLSHQRTQVQTTLSGRQRIILVLYLVSREVTQYRIHTCTRTWFGLCGTVLQFSKPHISTPYSKIGTTIVSNSSNCISIGKFNFLAFLSGLNVMWDDQRNAKSDYNSKNVKKCLSDKFTQNWNNIIMNSAMATLINDTCI
jgi:hypothetical protein